LLLVLQHRHQDGGVLLAVGEDGDDVERGPAPVRVLVLQQRRQPGRQIAAGLDNLVQPGDGALLGRVEGLNDFHRGLRRHGALGLRPHLPVIRL
jgi:hypothetical protein